MAEAVTEHKSLDLTSVVSWPKLPLTLLSWFPHTYLYYMGTMQQWLYHTCLVLSS